jgi:hypothetical protein
LSNLTSISSQPVSQDLVLSEIKIKHTRSSQGLLIQIIEDVSEIISAEHLLEYKKEILNRLPIKQRKDIKSKKSHRTYSWPQEPISPIDPCNLKRKLSCKGNSTLAVSTVIATLL